MATNRINAPEVIESILKTEDTLIQNLSDDKKAKISSYWFTSRFNTHGDKNTVDNTFCDNELLYGKRDYIELDKRDSKKSILKSISSLIKTKLKNR